MWRGVCSRRTLYCTAIVLLLCGSCGQCCGPGRSGWRRRSPRKLTPLVYKQHVPNVPENTLGASGLIQGRVTKSDTKFRELVPNYNKNIIFRDEEGTGVDRLMTERCKEKLNTLAISVMNQWPNVRLRVTESWKGISSRHKDLQPHSLHFEGRAVDISTTDKDRSKNGMLARLAVESGFDWVEYRTRSHIHCSVKSESRLSRKLGGCFPGSSNVMTPEGPRSIKLLKNGDIIRVMKADGSLSFSPIIMFLHEDHTAVRSFLSLTTESGTTITLTPSHLILILRRELATGRPPLLEEAIRKGEVLLAGQVRGGDFLLVTSNGQIRLEKIVDMISSTNSGVFAPLTEEGTVIMNNVVASCYAVIDSQRIAHWAFLPYRVYVHFKNSVLYMLSSIGLYSPTSNQIGSPKTWNASSSGLNSIVYNSSTKKDNNIYSLESPRAKESFEKDHHIHWYPYLLYTIASWVLPEHLVYS